VRGAPGLLLCLGGCFQPFITRVADDQPCIEAGYAIARRTEECTGDRELANERFHAFERAWKCIPTPPDDPEFRDIAPDLYGCAATISSLSCDAVEEFGDDLWYWLGVDPACGYVVEEKA
jgi:hypothetical protein